MKMGPIFFLFTVAFWLGSFMPNYAQSAMTNEVLLIIEKKRIKSPQGEKLSPREVEDITKTLNDPTINAHVSNARTQMNIGLGAMWAGVALEAISLVSLKKDNLGLIEFSSSSTSLLIGGCALLVGGVVVQRLGFKKLKTAAGDYNTIKSGKKGISYSIKPTVAPSMSGIQVGLNLRF